MPKWDWDKLRHENNNGRSKKYYADCQVVSAVNAYHVLTGKVAYKNEDEYRRLCKSAGAVHGSATSIGKVYKKLGLERMKPEYYPFGYRTGRLIYPVECTIWHSHYGLHNILIVDRTPKCEAVRITNFKQETTTDGWMFEENLNHFLSCCGGDWEKRMNRCRRIRLKK